MDLFIGYFIRVTKAIASITLAIAHSLRISVIIIEKPVQENAGIVEAKISGNRKLSSLF
ncbi:hypothetical protein [Mucilaginibacter sp.]|uniref:hypothetical protein n=1 Tax=Mucilaginibacter sp. TaxID=1882438 RepID=UPI002602815E|nr:hypothetical protein [Mucilaginibacter sp.]